MRFFGRKKKEETLKNVETAKESVTELEKLCGNDKEVYEALLNTMFLNPKKIDVSLEDAVKRAKNFEKNKDLLRAKVWYEIAGGLALYKGDAKKVKEYFGKCEKISGEKYLILKNVEKAVNKAQEYYRKYLA